MKNYNHLEQRFLKWRNTVNKFNRYYNDTELLDTLTINQSCLECHIEQGELFYRGRIFNLDDKVSNTEEYFRWKHENEHTFIGYNKEESGAPPPNSAKEGRLNGNGISFIYTCDNIGTVIRELRPTIGEVISVAEMITNKPCLVADLTRYDNKSIGDKEFIDLIKLISDEFATPHFAGHNYAFTQYLAGQFMNIGFDGVIFQSSLDTYGKNYVFFNSDQCSAINSLLFRVNNINVSYDPISRGYL